MGHREKKECPIFYPDEEEFKDFWGFLEKSISTMGNIGIFKVVPP